MKYWQIVEEDIIVQTMSGSLRKKYYTIINSARKEWLRLVSLKRKQLMTYKYSIYKPIMFVSQKPSRHCQIALTPTKQKEKVGSQKITADNSIF